MEARFPIAHPGLCAGVIGTARGGRADRARRPRMARLTVVADKAAMSEAAAERITSLIETAVTARGLAAVSLTGGTTPDLLYQFLGDHNHPWRDRIDWGHVH